MKTANQSLCARHGGKTSQRPRGFTLLELVIVIGIIALLATLSVPAFKGLGRSNVMGNAVQQFVGDINLARQQAIKLRTPVYIVFASTNIWDYQPQILSYSARYSDVWGQLDAKKATNVFNNLISGQHASYALLVLHEVGSQPGRDRARYLAPGWKTLPEGVIFPGMMFDPAVAASYLSSPDTNLTTLRPLPMSRFPFPVVGSDGVPPLTNALLPFIAFDAGGRLWIDRMNQAYKDPAANAVNPSYSQFYFKSYVDLTNSLALGSVFVPRDATGSNFINQAADIIELPKTNSIDNRIVISAITGRARILHPQLK